MRHYRKQIGTFAVAIAVIILPGGLVGFLLLYALSRRRKNAALSHLLRRVTDMICPVLQSLRLRAAPCRPGASLHGTEAA